MDRNYAEKVLERRGVSISDYDFVTEQFQNLRNPNIFIYHHPHLERDILIAQQIRAAFALKGLYKFVSLGEDCPEGVDATNWAIEQAVKCDFVFVMSSYELFKDDPNVQKFFEAVNVERINGGKKLSIVPIALDVKSVRLHYKENCPNNHPAAKGLSNFQPINMTKVGNRNGFLESVFYLLFMLSSDSREKDYRFHAPKEDSKKDLREEFSKLKAEIEEILNAVKNGSKPSLAYPKITEAQDKKKDIRALWEQLCDLYGRAYPGTQPKSGDVLVVLDEIEKLWK